MLYKNWLITCAILVYAMIILGGYTRLSHSGLSIVKWDPVVGIMPPLTEAKWQSEFLLYQKSPEYQKINFNMSIAEYKEIYLIEYFHRLLGRVIGLIFVCPIIFWWYKTALSKQDLVDYSVIALLIICQGFIGWYMVKSGLINNPSVSQYRLALHLTIASLILVAMVSKIVGNKISFSWDYGLFTLALLMMQIISGAFVAGLKAGLIYNSFPLMDGQYIPDGLFKLYPWYLNFFENITMVQFIHRIFALVNFINILFFLKNYPTTTKLKVLIFLALVLQIILGIITLIYQLPLLPALLHQAVAIALLMLIVISAKSKIAVNL